MTSPTMHAGKRATYPAYKPSGVPWLGDVPEHWQPIRLRYRTRINPTGPNSMARRVILTCHSSRWSLSTSTEA
jgi:hypothetical protein